MFTKIGATLASGALPVLLWAGSASAQQSQSQTTPTTQQQSQSQATPSTPSSALPTTNGTSGTSGTLARTGADDLLPLAVGGVALAGALAVRSVRRRSVA